MRPSVRPSAPRPLERTNVRRLNSPCMQASKAKQGPQRTPDKQARYLCCLDNDTVKNRRKNVRVLLRYTVDRWGRLILTVFQCLGRRNLRQLLQV